MLGLHVKARRKAIESRKASDGQSRPDLTTESGASRPKNSVPEIVAFNASQGNVPEPPERTFDDYECWARRADLQEPDDVRISPSQLDGLDRDRALALNARVYEALRPWQTRLIVLQPGELGSDVRCKLISVDVIDGVGLGVSGTSNIVTYEALSYSWGPPALVYSIYCNEKIIGVTEQLALALQYLRLSDAERYLWCDAICINQQDLPEKARQVKNMLRIFEKADRVVAWLGPPLPTSAKFFKALDLVSSLSKMDSPSKHQHQGSCAEAMHNITLAVTKHLEVAWFKRTWIRQEVYAAQSLILQSGRFRSDFITFTRSLARMQKTLASFDTSQDCLRIPPTLQIYENEYQHFGSDGPSFKLNGIRPSYVQYWLNNLDTGLQFDVTDERDRIYGALGFLTSRIVVLFAEVPAELGKMAETFPIDYSKSLSRVHEDVTKFLINTTKLLEILDVFQDTWHRTSPERASWNSDFNRKRERYHLPQTRSQAIRDSAEAPTQSYLEVGKLILRGVRVVKRIQRIDGEKEIGHPQDRFVPKYRRPITLRHITLGSSRRSNVGPSSSIDNPPCSFIFSRVKEIQQSHTVSMSHQLTKSEDMNGAFATFLSSDRFAFAYVEDFEDETTSFDLAPLHFLVPRTASLNDTIVSLYGSRCLHLIRPLCTHSSRWTYIGPVAAVAIGSDTINKYRSASFPGNRSTWAFRNIEKEAETFELH